MIARIALSDVLLKHLAITDSDGVVEFIDSSGRELFRITVMQGAVPALEIMCCDSVKIDGGDRVGPAASVEPLSTNVIRVVARPW